MEVQDEKIGDAACGFSGEIKPQSPVISAQDEMATEDEFYEKLGKLNESSGLSLVFNFREANIDLLLLYEEVITRGGFYQVSEDGKWDEVESALNLKNYGSLSPAQLQKVYEIILLQFEQVYAKMQDDSNACPDNNSPGPLDFEATPGCSIGKRKHSEYSGDPEGPEEKGKITGDTCLVAAGSKIINQNSTGATSYVHLYGDVPIKPRTGYQIFLRLECRRLKMIHGENSGSQKIRDMAVHAWRSLSDKDKKPYIDASKIDKARYGTEMARYIKLRQNKENVVERKCNMFSSNYTSPPSMDMVRFSDSQKTDNDCYRVSFQDEADCENILPPDDFMVELAVKAMKNAESNDQAFQIDWGSGYLLDMSS